MRRLTQLFILLALALAAFVVPAARADAAALVVAPVSAPQNSLVVASLVGFAPKEVVSLWFTLPDYRVVPVGDVAVDSSGAASLELRLGPELPVGRHNLSARGNRSGSLASTQLEVVAGVGASPSPVVSLRVAQARLPQGECFSFHGTGYAPLERIAVWLRLPDGAVTADGLGPASADGAGAFEYQICFGNLAAVGSYAFTAYGTQSERTGVVEFNLDRGDYLAAPAGDAVLFVDPPQARQLDSVAVVGGGFAPGEVIHLWLTMPNGVVLDLFSGRSEDGTFVVELALPPLPVGTHYLSAYGATSGERAVAPLELLPGDGG